jgi:hypothetical protein
MTTFTPRFSEQRWHGIDSGAAMNLAAPLLRRRVRKAFEKRFSRIFERFSKACRESQGIAAKA